MPEVGVTAKTVNKFKSKLNDTWKHNPLKFDVYIRYQLMYYYTIHMYLHVCTICIVAMCHIIIISSYDLTFPSSLNSLLFPAFYCSGVLYVLVDCKVALTNKISCQLLVFRSYSIITVSCHAYCQMYYDQKDVIAFGLQVQHQVVKKGRRRIGSKFMKGIVCICWVLQNQPI